jgi:SAM-dependent methyltransferase
MPKSTSVNWWRFSPIQILEKYSARTFDRRYGTDTSTFADLNALDIASEHKRHGERYQPSPVYSLQRLLRRLGIDYPAFSFIDFGSGKGRTLLIAGELPFKKVIGVEFSKELHLRAEQNIARYPRRGADMIQAVHADASQFELPPTDLVLYFFNPFNRPVLSKVLGNINASLKAQPRKVILIYLFLPDEEWLTVLDGFRLREKWHYYCVFEYTPPRMHEAP